MLGIGLGVVMEKYYKFNGRDVTGDELVSLVHCLTAEGQKGANEVRASKRRFTRFENGVH